MPWNISVKSLVNAKEAKKIGRNFVSGSAAFALPKQCSKVVCLA